MRQVKVHLQVLGHEPIETGLSFDRLQYGEPNKDAWKSAVLYLSGPLKEHSALLDLTEAFDIRFIETGKEFARMQNAVILESVILEDFKTIAVQVSGKMKIGKLPDEAYIMTEDSLVQRMKR